MALWKHVTVSSHTLPHMESLDATMQTISHYMEAFVLQFLFSFGNTWVRCILY